MRILFLTVYFPPEAGPPQARNYEMARLFTEWGHEVTVLTAFPNHPTGVIPKEYRGKLFARETMDGMRVLRTTLYPAPNRGFWRWSAKHLSFSVTSLMASPLAGGYDIIVVGSASLFLGLTAHAISLYKRVPWVFTVADLWPATAVAQGRLSNPTLIRLARGLASAVYNRAGAVVAVSQAMCEEVVRNGVPEGRVFHIPNGTDTNLFHPQADGGWLRNELGLRDRFVVMYAGSMGPAHGLTVIVEAAKLLRDDPVVRFVMAGDGSVKQDLVEMAAREGADNISWVGRQPQTRMPEVFNAADVVIVPQRKSEFFAGVVPFKTAEAMACARPIIMASPPGEATTMLEAAGAGLVIEPESPRALAEAILKIKDQPEEAAEMGRRGRLYSVENLDRAKLAKRFEQVLLDLVSTKKKGRRGPASEKHATRVAS